MQRVNQDRKYQSIQEALEAIQENLRLMRESSQSKKDGSQNSKPNGVYECPVCQDKEGFIIKQEDGTEVWRYCDACRMKRKIQRLMKVSQITDEYKRLLFSNFILEGRPVCVRTAYYTAREYLANFEKNLTKRQNSIALVGPPGSGKTHLLMAVANRLISQGIGVVYFPWVDGLNDLKGDWDKINNKVHLLKTVEVLFIDDLFKGRRTATDWQREQLFEIINYRYMNYLPIMVSSEKTFNDMMDIDEGLASRLYEMCKGFMSVMNANEPNLNFRLLETSQENRRMTS